MHKIVHSLFQFCKLCYKMETESKDAKHLESRRKLYDFESNNSKHN